MNKREVGADGEDLASRYLRKKGYKIIETNFRCTGGEIDIIAGKKGAIHFVEVKLRNTRDFGSPLEAVTERKKEKILRTAQHYCIARRLDNPVMKFDVIGIDFSGSDPVIDHIENAFS